MLRVLIARLGQAALVVALVVSSCFVIVRLAPGDPFAQQLEGQDVAPELRERLRAAYGLDRTLPEQFVRFVRSAVRGELGYSEMRKRDVSSVLGQTLPNTLVLMGTALLIGLSAGVTLGAWQGWRPESPLARVTDRLGLLVLSVPEFVLALLLVLVPALALGLFPVGGMRSVVPPAGFAGVLDRAHHLVLPASALALMLTAVVARHQRAAMRDLRDAVFVRAARARGVPERRIFWRHAVRNALVPVLTLVGVLFPALFGGAVIVEKIFAWPGMGSTMVDAVLSRDYHLVVGGVLVGSVCVVLGTLLADLALLWADPRQRRL